MREASYRHQPQGTHTPTSPIKHTSNVKPPSRETELRAVQTTIDILKREIWKLRTAITCAGLPIATSELERE